MEIGSKLSISMEQYDRHKLSEMFNNRHRSTRGVRIIFAVTSLQDFPVRLPNSGTITMS